MARLLSISRHDVELNEFRVGDHGGSAWLDQFSRAPINITTSASQGVRPGRRRRLRVVVRQQPLGQDRAGNGMPVFSMKARMSASLRRTRALPG